MSAPRPAPPAAPAPFAAAQPVPGYGPIMPFPPGRITAVLAAQAVRWPAAPAILTGTECWTHAQLEEYANQLAHRLRAQGIGQGAVVGVALDRATPRLVQAVWALWKIGAIYLPLDPAAPVARVAFVLEDAGATWVLTETSPPGPLPPTLAQILTLEDLEAGLHHCPSTPPPEQGTGADPAYIIYTSGSTGVPKGVLLYHRGLCNVQLAQQEVFGLDPDDRVLQFSHGTYDASIFEIVLALSAGAALVLLPASARQPGPALVRLCQDLGVTVAVLTPSVLASLPPTDLPTLRTIIAAGEACPAELVRRWASEGRRFFNAYGPTESTIWATVARCQPDGREPAIGGPIANTDLFVLDPDDATRQAALGVVGELAIGGAGLGRYQDPGQQAMRFVPHPHAAGALLSGA
jgi:amino acid adenylation domain-containing protein